MIRTISLAEVLAPVRADLEAVETQLHAVAGGCYPSLDAAVTRLLAAGGKRLRPALVLLVARMLDRFDARHIYLAAAIELVHTASLVHDDLLDGATLRRGSSTLNTQYSPAATVLIGDYLFAHAAELGARTELVRVVRILTRVLTIIVESEMGQLDGRRWLVTHEAYFRRIYGKTASLFEAAAEAAAVLAGVDTAQTEALRRFGCDAGMAFQIVDDVLDLCGTEAEVGKPVGNDLRQGLFTLPVLCYLDENPGDSDLAALREGGAADPELLARIVQTVRVSRGPAAALAEARAYAERAQAALVNLPENIFRQSLMDLADYFVSRSM